MKKISIFLILSAAFILSSCGTDETAVNSVDTIQSLIFKATDGDSLSNDSLSGIFSSKYPPPGKWNSLSIDSIYTSDGKKFFSVLVEYANPVYNLFCIYDSLLNLHLVDRSLNGYLKMNKSENNLTSVTVVEMFDSKDSIKLKRTSVYSYIEERFALVFRSFTEMRLRDLYINQEISSLTQRVLRTKIKSSKGISLKNYEDTFLFDTGSKTYKSGEDIVNNYIRETLYSYSTFVRRPVITDELSAVRSTGGKISNDTVNMYNNFKDGEKGYSLFLPPEWRVNNDFIYLAGLKKDLPMTKFTSDDEKVYLYVAKLKEGKKAEEYSKIPLDSKNEGNYIVRYSEKMESGDKYIQYFEFNCLNLTFFMVLECTIKDYETEKTIINEIVNSFAIDC